MMRRPTTATIVLAILCVLSEVIPATNCAPVCWYLSNLLWPSFATAGVIVLFAHTPRSVRKWSLRIGLLYPFLWEMLWVCSPAVSECDPNNAIDLIDCIMYVIGMYGVSVLERKR